VTYNEKPDSDQVKFLEAYEPIRGWPAYLPWPFSREAFRLAKAQSRARYNGDQRLYEAALRESRGGSDA
jgi:hypothetical protein